MLQVRGLKVSFRSEHGDQQLAGQVEIVSLVSLHSHKSELVIPLIEGKVRSPNATDYTLFCEFMGRAIAAPDTYNRRDESTPY